MSTVILGPGSFGPQPIASDETLISSGGPATTTITDTGGYYTFGVNFASGVNSAQLGDLSGDGFTIQATSPGGTAVQILGSNDTLDGNILSANDSTVNGNGADLITGAGANNLHVEGNTFAGTGFALAYVNGALDTYTSSQQVDFLNNKFTGTATAGVDLVDDAASGTITGNTFTGAGDAAIYLGHLSKAAADYFNAKYGTNYVPEAGTITVSNNDFSHFTGTDIVTFDANYTFANGGAGHSLTSTIGSNGSETVTLTGYQNGDTIDLNHGVTASKVQQHGNGEVDVSLSDGNTLIIEGDGLKAKDIVSLLGVAHDHGNHVGFAHSNHFGYDFML